MQNTITAADVRHLGFNKVETYVAAMLFIAGNIILPQICHLFSLGGPTWLPIYFFTLVGAYKYGWRVGLLTALASPFINSVFFGMPATAALPAITIKSVLLAGAAGFASSRNNRASILTLLAVVLFYQVTGSAAEWIITGSIAAAMQDFTIGVPGMLVQILGGWFVINRVIRG